MDITKRVIILNKLNSPLIAQAIFILKDDNIDEFSAVAEAERIVGEFMDSAPTSKRSLHLLPVIVTVLAALGVVLAVLFQ